MPSINRTRSGGRHARPALGSRSGVVGSDMATLLLSGIPPPPECVSVGLMVYDVIATLAIVDDPTGTKRSAPGRHIVSEAASLDVRRNAAGVAAQLS